MSSPVADNAITAECFQPGLDLRLRGAVGCHCWAKEEQCRTFSWFALCLPYLMHFRYIFYFRMRSPQVDSYYRWANVCYLFNLGYCKMFHLRILRFVFLKKFAVWDCIFIGFSYYFFFKLVLAAGGKGMILNGLMCYKRHKEAASSTSYTAVVMSRGWESLGWPRITTHLSVADSWLLSEVISPIPIEFFFNVPPPPFPHLFQLL